MRLPRLPPPPPTPCRRVVVTGVGAVTPLGATAPASFAALLRGECGVVSVADRFPGLPSTVAGVVSRGGLALPPPGDARTSSVDFVAFALAAAAEALACAGLSSSAGGGEGALPATPGPLGPYPSSRVGVSVGAGIGAIDEIGAAAVLLEGEGGLRRLSPFFVPRILINMAAGHVSLAHGLTGPSMASATACASGAHAIGDAFRAIKHGYADAMVAGGSEACVNRISLAGFSRMRALATGFNGDPQAASRPWDDARCGFVLGEGAGMLVLEERGAALARGAVVLAELRGYGSSSDAFHITTPRPGGGAALACMLGALSEGGLWGAGAPPLREVLGYINAHATSTPVGDGVEAEAIGRLLRGAGEGGGRVTVSSTKGATGHLLGAAGAVEAVFTVLGVAGGVLPGNRNLLHPARGLPTDVADFPTASVQRGVAAALSNSFGFGGTNSSLLFTQGGGEG